MSLNVVVVMDPIERIKPAKDTTFALMLEAQRRGHTVLYVMPGSLGMRGGEASARLVQYVDAVQTLFVRLSAPWALGAGAASAALLTGCATESSRAIQTPQVNTAGLQTVAVVDSMLPDVTEAVGTAAPLTTCQRPSTMRHERE